MRLLQPLTLAVALVPLALTAPARAGDFVMGLTPGSDRHWIGPEYWTNPLQDWRLANQRVECQVSGGDRNVALLTHALEKGAGPLEMVVRFGALDGDIFEAESGWVGFRIGARGEFDDYRDDALCGRGLDLGVLADGRLFVGAPQDDAPVLSSRIGPFALRAVFMPSPSGYSVALSVEGTGERELAKLESSGIDADWLVGGLALVASSTAPVGVDPRSPRPAQRAEPDTKRGGSTRVWFADWRMVSPMLTPHPERGYGPILFAQHTLSRNVLRISAQMAAVDQPPGQLGLEIQGPHDEAWRWLGSAVIDPLTYVATWRVEPWDDTRDVRYRIATGMRGQMGEPVRYEFIGTIRKDPRDEEDFVVAAFAGGGDLGFPHQDVVEHVSWFDPDVLVFTGDQVTESVGGYGAQREPVDVAMHDYLRKWALFGWTFRELLRDRPSLCLPDDRDVYQDDLWGAGGKLAEGSGTAARDAGGYTMDKAFVNGVQATQTSHHPDPASPTPIGAGIDTFYGDMLYGGVSFAVVESRKWKSAPAAAGDGNVDGAELLGDPQLEFLERWADDWSGDAWMKVVVSQALFANVATSGTSAAEDAVFDPRAYPEGQAPMQDHGSNGWPQSGRKRALEAMRRGFAVHIAGDQHLGSVIQYGIDDWGDAAHALCVTPLVNDTPRHWFPPEPGAPGTTRGTGRYLDGFGNKLTVFGVANPVRQGIEPAKLHDHAPGYGIVRFRRDNRTVEMANWPRSTDPARPDASAYPGSIGFTQLGNHGPAPHSRFLPTLEFQGIEDPVVRVIAESDGEVVYTLRVEGKRFDPFVFEPGSYTIEVESGEPDAKPLRLEGLAPSDAPGVERRTVQFGTSGS